MLGDDPDDPGRDAARSAGPPPRARRSRTTRAAQPMASAATTARGHRKRPMTRHDTLPRRKGGPTMTTRREFLGTTTGALAGLAFVGCDLLAAAPVRAQTRRREVVVSGRRVKT